MVELLLLAAEDSVESVSDALMDDCGALSVSVEDADAGTADERALYGEPGMPAPGAGWQRSLVKALFEGDEQATKGATFLLASAAPALRVLRMQPVEDQDWVQLTQAQFGPVEITPAFWIVPSWHEAPAAARRVVRLDPGMAFGTGTHPTTRMCLRWIADTAERTARPIQRVLDYGCGSGILAIAAALHGASAVDAVDIDPAAVDATRRNAGDNGVAITAGLPELASGRYEWVLANILATPLRLLAPLLCGHLEDGAALVLAGILERQADELIAAYSPWLRLEVGACDDGWILMVGHRG